jgi:hypothetical protein
MGDCENSIGGSEDRRSRLILRPRELGECSKRPVSSLV